MYENHRKSFNRDDRRDFGEERYGEDRWRGERGGGRSSYRDDRSDWERRDQGSYGRSRDEDYGRRSGYEPASGPEYWRGGHGGYDSERGRFSNDPRHHHPGRDGGSYGYGAGRPYGGGEGDSRYFTGTQGSWAVGSSYGGGGGGFGSDYREHGYGSHDDHEDRGFWDRATDEVASWFGDDEAARRREADHRGRGPKDYIRSDERIREDANDRLTDDPRVDASNITLTVQTGELTLNGTVGSRNEKRRAEDVVERISGVKHVQNNLRVAEAGASQTAQTGGSDWTMNPGSSVNEGGTIAQPESTPRQNAKA